MRLRNYAWIPILVIVWVIALAGIFLNPVVADFWDRYLINLSARAVAWIPVLVVLYLVAKTIEAWYKMVKGFEMKDSHTRSVEDG